jgi:hypothetical protein
MKTTFPEKYYTSAATFNNVLIFCPQLCVSIYFSLRNAPPVWKQHSQAKDVTALNFPKFYRLQRKQ